MERKFTDDAIVKALECCREKDCGDCPMIEYPQTICKWDAFDLAIDLINRQKAEIERLREIRDLCNTTILEKSELIEKLKISDASKEECTMRQHGEIKELKSEIERLQKHNTKMAHKHYCDGIKEFSEKLKAKAMLQHGGVTVVYGSDIDNLVKEMTGENNGN